MYVTEQEKDVKIAKELGYSKNVIMKLMNEENDIKRQNILIDARKNNDYNYAYLKKCDIDEAIDCGYSFSVIEALKATKPGDAEKRQMILFNAAKEQEEEDEL